MSLSPTAQRWAAFYLFALLWGYPSPALGRPQVSAGVTTGIALAQLHDRHGPRLAYHLGLRVDALLFRESPGGMAFGPYIEGLTIAFDTLEAGGGVAWLVPTGSTAFVFSGGGFGRGTAAGWGAGASASAFWGSRSYNFHSSYALAAGAFAQARYGFGSGSDTAFIGGVQVDLEYLALPFIGLYRAMSR